MPTTYDGAHWRDKAEKARILAAQTEDALSRDVLLQLAVDADSEGLRPVIPIEGGH